MRSESGQSTKTLAQRLWARVDVKGPDECWPWLGFRLPKGYGRLSFEGQHYYVHRTGWILTHGPIPEGMCVCHHCDNPPCCNPKHLFLGTNGDNQADMTRKGRGRFGGRNGRSILTANQVSEIRRRYAEGDVSQDALAKEYGVDQAAVSCLIRRITWKHV